MGHCGDFRARIRDHHDAVYCDTNCCSSRVAGGKLKTVTQIVAISLWLLPLTSLPGFVTVVAWIAMGGAVVVTVVTGVEYLVHGVRVARNGRGPEGGDRS